MDMGQRRTKIWIGGDRRGRGGELAIDRPSDNGGGTLHTQTDLIMHNDC